MARLKILGPGILGLFIGMYSVAHSHYKVFTIGDSLIEGPHTIS